MIEVDIYLGKVCVDGRRVDLTMQEYRLILWFWLHPAGRFSIEDLRQRVFNSWVSDEGVWSLISRVNKKLGRKAIVRRKGFVIRKYRYQLV